MAEDMVIMTQMVNPCCAVLKEKHSKLEKMRLALRQGVDMQNKMIDELQSENKALKLAYNEEKEKADNERHAKEKQLAVQVSLKNEICSLKAQILASKENTTCKGAQDSSKEVKSLQTRISEGLREINLLKENLEKETSKAEYESKRALEGKKEAQANLKLAEAEKRRADEEKRLANAEREKARENLLLVEKMKAEATELKSKLASEGVKYRDVKEKLEVEKQKAMKGKKTADMATAKAEEHRKLTEINQNKVTEVQLQANQLNQQLEEHKRRIEKLEKERNELLSFKRKVGASKQSCKCITVETTERDVALPVSLCETENVSNKLLKNDKHKNHGKNLDERTMVADINFKKPKEKKHHADKLSLQLKDNIQMMEGLMKEVKLVASMKSIEGSNFPPERNVTREDAEMKFLKKKLKFEKIQVKHFKNAAKLETVRNNILQQEMSCLKQDLISFTSRLNVLNNCITSTEGTHHLDKTYSRVLDMPNIKMPEFFRNEPSHLNSQNTHDHLKGNTEGCMKLLKHPVETSQPMAPMDEGILTKCITGIASQLESLPRGCNKCMQTSAVNSSTTSFSNRQFVGSQERVSPFACTSLKLTESNPEANMSSLSGQDTRIENNKQLAVVVEKLDVVAKGHTHKKRKSVHDGIDSIGYNQHQNNQWQMQIEQKRSMLHDMPSQIKGPLDEKLSGPGLVCKPNSKTKVHKKKKVCIGHEENPRKLLVSNVNENIHDGLDNSIKRISESMGNYEYVSEFNYMRVLDLDNYSDEECYRRAIEEPLSPTLPEISLTNFLSSERGMDDCVVGDISHEGCLIENKRSVSDCTLHIDSKMADSCKFNKDTLCLPVGIKMADSHSLSDKDAITSFHAMESPPCNLLPKYCIIFSDINDSCSISRVLNAIGSCMALCKKADLTDLTFQKIMLSFMKTEDLSHKEKSCVLLSLELHIFSEIALGKLENLNEHLMIVFHSIAEQMQSVISDLVTRNNFVELYTIGELLILIEEFLLDWRVMELHDVLLDGVNLPSSSPIINVVLNGTEKILKSRMASTHEFMVGGILLASICAATNNIGFLCMASYNMLRVSKIELSLRLTILHVFACICGPNYFKPELYHLGMTMIKSLVTFHEKANLSTMKCPLNGCEVFREVSSTKCPFSEDAISVESVNSLLLEELQKIGLSDALHQNLLNLFALGYMDKGGSKLSCSRSLIPSVFESDDATLCCFTDILSLLELMAFYMSWEWTYKNTISRLLKTLDSCMEKDVAIVIIILLGKLGRFGVDACGGSEHSSIANIINHLSNFLSQPKTRFPIQVSAFSTLLDLLSIPYEELMNINLQAAAISETKIGNADCLRKWYSNLSNEQRSLVTNLNCAGH